MTIEEIKTLRKIGYFNDVENITLEEVDKLLARVEELERSKLDIIKSFVEEVERMAESKMLKTGKLEGAHHAAMKKRLKEIEAEIAEVEQ